MLNPMVQAARLCCIITVKTADCAPPTKLIHVVRDSFAGYLFNVNAYNFSDCKAIFKNIILNLTNSLLGSST